MTEPDRAPSPWPSLCAALWPGPATVEVRGPLAAADYVAVPNVARARLLLPADRRLATSVLKRFPKPGGSRSRALALRAAVSVSGGWPAATQRLRVHRPGPPHETIEDVLRRAVDSAAGFGVQLGPARANLKPIIQVMDANGRELAIAKLGIDALTGSLVECDGTTLETLAALQLPNMRTPALLHRETWNGNELVVMTVLPTHRAVHPVAEPLRTAAAVTLSRALGTETMRPADSNHLQCLRAELEGQCAAPGGAHLVAVLDELMASLDTWTFGAWHGDWMTWNMAQLDREVLVWDWERFARGVPVGWDALHYALREAIAARAPRSEVAIELLDRAPDLLQPFGVPAGQATGVAKAYLVELATRYIRDDQRSKGGRSARVEDWLVPALLAR